MTKKLSKGQKARRKRTLVNRTARRMEKLVLQGIPPTRAVILDKAADEAVFRAYQANLISGNTMRKYCGLDDQETTP